MNIFVLLTLTLAFFQTSKSSEYRAEVFLDEVAGSAQNQEYTLTKQWEYNKIKRKGSNPYVVFKDFSLSTPTLKPQKGQSIFVLNKKRLILKVTNNVKYEKGITVKIYLLNLKIEKKQKLKLNMIFQVKAGVNRFDFKLDHFTYDDKKATSLVIKNENGKPCFELHFGSDSDTSKIASKTSVKPSNKTESQSSNVNLIIDKTTILSFYNKKSVPFKNKRWDFANGPVEVDPDCNRVRVESRYGRITYTRKTKTIKWDKLFQKYTINNPEMPGAMVVLYTVNGGKARVDWIGKLNTNGMCELTIPKLGKESQNLLGVFFFQQSWPVNIMGNKSMSVFNKLKKRQPTTNHLIYSKGTITLKQASQFETARRFFTPTAPEGSLIVMVANGRVSNIHYFQDGEPPKWPIVEEEQLLGFSVGSAILVGAHNETLDFGDPSITAIKAVFDRSNFDKLSAPNEPLDVSILGNDEKTLFEGHIKDLEIWPRGGTDVHFKSQDFTFKKENIDGERAILVTPLTKTEHYTFKNTGDERPPKSKFLLGGKPAKVAQTHAKENGDVVVYATLDIDQAKMEPIKKSLHLCAPGMEHLNLTCPDTAEPYKVNLTMKPRRPEAVIVLSGNAVTTDPDYFNSGKQILLKGWKKFEERNYAKFAILGPSGLEKYKKKDSFEQDAEPYPDSIDDFESYQQLSEAVNLFTRPKNPCNEKPPTRLVYIVEGVHRKMSATLDDGKIPIDIISSKSKPKWWPQPETWHQVSWGNHNNQSNLESLQKTLEEVLNW